MPAFLSRENLRANRRDYVDAYPTSELNRGLGDMTRSYLEGMVPQDELAEYKELERAKNRFSKRIKGEK